MTKNFYRVVKKKITFDGLFHEKKNGKLRTKLCKFANLK